MKTINIKVIPNAKKNNISEENSILKIRVTAPAIDNKANKAVIRLLAEFFKVKKNSIRIIRGKKSREKVVELIKN